MASSTENEEPTCEQLLTYSSFRPFLMEDPKIEEIWKEPIQTELFPRTLAVKKEENFSIYIQHISGYGGNYEEKKEKLKKHGFSCLRSLRGSDGLYWEIWYLCSKWAFKGHLKENSTKEILDWVITEIKPGQIEISGKKWALSFE